MVHSRQSIPIENLTSHHPAGAHHDETIPVCVVQTDPVVSEVHHPESLFGVMCRKVLTVFVNPGNLQLNPLVFRYAIRPFPFNHHHAMTISRGKPGKPGKPLTGNTYFHSLGYPQIGLQYLVLKCSCLADYEGYPTMDGNIDGNIDGNSEIAER